jgi:hypothetical protein
LKGQLAHGSLNTNHIPKAMNSFNALGFLALGSMMNALPAIAPALVDRGGVVIADLSPSALWLHLMGFVIGTIGGSWVLRDAFAQVTFRPVSTRVARPVTVPERAAPAMVLTQPARAAA